MKILFFILFFLGAIVHLYGCLPKKNHSIAKYTKPLLMPLLIMAYGFGVTAPSLLLIAGLVFACLGNCFLLHPEKNVFLKVGYTSYGLSLLLPALYLLARIGLRPTFWVLALAVVGFAGLIGFVLYRITPHAPRDVAPFVCILTVSGAVLGLSGLLFAFTNGVFSAKLTLLGILLLITSGLLHLRYRFYKRFRFGMTAITALYLAGQSVLIFSLMAMGGN